MKPTLRPATVAALLFSSGLCALIYQTVWLREFRLIFGASTAASAAVLGIFMGGLGLGSAFLGQRAERARKPLLLYANLEVLIAVFAALTPFIMLGVRELYSASGGTIVLGHGVGTVVRLLMASIVLIGPTFLMGGTLPAAARSITSDSDPGRRRLALLYGTNTLGAVTGAAISTFWLVETFGNRTALWLACGLNLLVAMAARAISRASETDAVPAATDVKEVQIEGAPEAKPNFPLVVVSSAMVGFAFMMMELVWYRMLGPILGGSTFTFGLILVVALLGIGLGGVAYTLRGAGRVATLNGFAFTCALEALFIALPLALGDRLAFLALMLRPLGSLGFGAQILGWSIIAGIVVLPAAIIAGYQFPMLISLLGKGRAGVARHTGIAYAANTAGAIAGSLAGGFGLLPLITAIGAWKAVVVLLVVLALLAAFFGAREAGRLRWMPALAASASIAMLFAQGPTAVWRHGGIGAGRADPTSPHINYFKNWSHVSERSRLWEAEGVESSVALYATSAMAFVVNGKVDGNARADAGTQVMSGVLGALLHPNPKTAMVVGLGTGSTAGWLGALPGMEKVDVVELEPAILDVARDCAPVNCNVMANPKVHRHLGDAREVLITTPERYDIIFSEPSNPYRAGIASLFTRDFYASAQHRLAPGGLFIQWVQAYEIDSKTIQTVLGTVASCFPHVQMWRPLNNDLLLVASKEPLELDAEALRKRIAGPVFKEALFNAWRVDTLEGVFAHFVANEQLALHAAKCNPEIATDDRNPLEYGFARGVGRHEVESIAEQIVAFSRKSNFHRPLRLAGKVDWETVDALEPATNAVEFVVTNPIADESPIRARRREFFSAFIGKDYVQAMKVARANKLAPASPMEVAALAESAVAAADPLADLAIERLEQDSPSEALALRAFQIAGRKEFPAAVEALVKALGTWKKDPWVRPSLLEKCLTASIEIARASKDPELARALFNALETPFAVELLREARLQTRFELAKLVDPKPDSPLLGIALEPYAKHPMWNRGFLSQRVRIYRAANDPRSEVAEADLLDFLQNEPVNFSQSLEVEKVPDAVTASAD